MEERTNIYRLKKRILFFVLLFHVLLLFLLNNKSSLMVENDKAPLAVRTVVVKSSPPEPVANKTEISQIVEAPQEIEKPVAVLPPLENNSLPMPPPVAVIQEESFPEPEFVPEQDLPAVRETPKEVAQPVYKPAQAVHEIKKEKKVVKKAAAAKPKKIVKKSPPAHKLPVKKKSAAVKKLNPPKAAPLPKTPKRNVPHPSHPTAASEEIEKLLKKMEKSLSNIENADYEQSTKATHATTNKTTKASAQNVSPVCIESLHVNAQIEVAPELNMASSLGNEGAFSCEGQLISDLQNMLDLPEYGEVKLQLEISGEGKVNSVKVLEAKSEKNQKYLKNSLPNLSFPWFNQFFSKEKSLVFIITFKNK